MRVHLVQPPDPDLRAPFTAALDPRVVWSSGAMPDPAAEILVVGVPEPAQLAACPGLRALVVPWAGLPRKTAELLRERPGVAVHNLHHNAAATAEMALALLLAAAKNVLEGDARLRRGDWSLRHATQHAVQLEGRGALVLGLGEIGRRVARACLGLGMRVRGVSRSGRPVEGLEVFKPGPLPELLPHADALLICLPATPDTEGLLGHAELALLPRDCVLVNVARAAVVDELALYEALRDRRIRAAGLDVWWRYPGPEGRDATLPATQPFHELPNVVLSPHRAGHVMDIELRRLLALAELLNAAARGEPMPNRVDLTRGY